MEIDLHKTSWFACNTAIENTIIDNQATLRVTKAKKINEYDENTYAKLVNFNFHNGTIEVDMLSKLLPDAPDFARGFIGIAYRINEDDSVFESFYIRPTNGRSCTDPVRKTHGCQYFSYQNYTFAYFREHDIKKYEAPTNTDLNEWIHLKAVIQDEKATFYVNDMKNPVLTVNPMIHGNTSGSIGFFVDIGTEAYFKNLTIQQED